MSCAANTKKKSPDGAITNSNAQIQTRRLGSTGKSGMACNSVGTMASLTIQLLGNAQIRTATGAPVVLRRRARLLLFYLAGQSDALSRERCVTVFWPDEAPDTARQSLRTALYQIKVACGPVIQSDQQTLRLDPNVEVDIRLLQDAQ
ncbi:MAG: hypothetical protein RLY87_2244, partial [Chloroflexota bacterium]